MKKEFFQLKKLNNNMIDNNKNILKKKEYLIKVKLGLHILTYNFKKTRLRNYKNLKMFMENI